MEYEITICGCCGGVVEGVGASDESWSVCTECRAVEQETVDMTYEEWERYEHEDRPPFKDFFPLDDERNPLFKNRR